MLKAQKMRVESLAPKGADGFPCGHHVLFLTAKARKARFAVEPVP